jgi:hypothetical protein
MDQDRDAPLTFLVPGRNELADPLYGARANRDYIKQHGIQFAAKPLGRPPRLTGVIREQLTPPKAQRRHDYWQRIPIEGKFGQGKHGYRFNYIRAIPRSAGSTASFFCDESTDPAKDLFCSI